MFLLTGTVSVWFSRYFCVDYSLCLFNFCLQFINFYFKVPTFYFGAVLVLHTPNIKYVFEIYLGIICIAVGKSGKENIEGLKTIQLSTVIVTLLYSTSLDDLTVKGLILPDFVFFIAE